MKPLQAQQGIINSDRHWLAPLGWVSVELIFGLPFPQSHLYLYPYTSCRQDNFGVKGFIGGLVGVTSRTAVSTTGGGDFSLLNPRWWSLLWSPSSQQCPPNDFCSLSWSPPTPYSHPVLSLHLLQLSILFPHLSEISSILPQVLLGFFGLWVVTWFSCT